MEENNENLTEIYNDNQDNQDIQDIQDNQDIQEKKTKRKKTNYVLTPARKAQIEKMNQARKNKIEEKKKLQSSLATKCRWPESKIILKKCESQHITSSESSSNDSELSKNSLPTSDSSDETMIISGFDDDEPNKEAVIKINKKKIKEPNKKII